MRAGAIAFFCAVAPLAAHAQTPITTIPDITPDQLNFEGRSSVLLGSGARALGMGGAFLARPDDATAASWNPAGLSYLRRPELSLVVGRNEQRRRDPDAGVIKDDFVGTSADFAALAYPVEIGPALGSVQLSFQRVFSFTGVRDLQQESERSTVFELDSEGGIDVFALGTGLRVARQWRLGFTLNHWTNGFDQRRSRIAARRTVEDTELEISAWNANVGVIFSPVESLNLAAVVKTPFTAGASLRRARTDRFPVNTDGISNETTNAAYRSDLEIEFPAALGVGLSWRPISTLTIAADVTRTLWSDGRIHNYYTLGGQEPGGTRPDPVVFPLLPYPSLTDPDQQDTTQFRTGVEYVVLAGRVRFPVRGGWFTDSQYFRDNRGDGPQYRGFTVGTGVLLGPVLLDAAYLRVSGNYLEDPVAPHRVSTRLQRVLLSLIFRPAR